MAGFVVWEVASRWAGLRSGEGSSALPARPDRVNSQGEQRNTKNSQTELKTNKQTNNHQQQQQQKYMTNPTTTCGKKGLIQKSHNTPLIFFLNLTTLNLGTSYWQQQMNPTTSQNLQRPF